MFTFTDEYDERDVELGLVKHIEKFLVEMGARFAFMGRQYHIEVSGNDFYIDILMYNAFMHRYLVVSDYELGKALPKDIKSGLPSIEELESKLSRELEDNTPSI